jgi:hypothetical protein
MTNTTLDYAIGDRQAHRLTTASAASKLDAK